MVAGVSEIGNFVLHSARLDRSRDFNHHESSRRLILPAPSPNHFPPVFGDVYWTPSMSASPEPAVEEKPQEDVKMDETDEQKQLRAVRQSAFFP